MLTIPYNGEPCDRCGFGVAQLAVGVYFWVDDRCYRANCTLPCGCYHAVASVSTDVTNAIGTRASVAASR